MRVLARIAKFINERDADDDDNHDQIVYALAVPRPGKGCFQSNDLTSQLFFLINATGTIRKHPTRGRLI